MTIRFGIIGCGGIARWHAGAINAVPAAELAAVCDAYRPAAEAMGKEYGVPCFDDPQALFESGLVDAVCVCTPSGLHAQLAAGALRAGLHALVEKPLAITPESLDEVLAAEAESGRYLSAVCQMRYADGVKKAKQMIDEGALGRVTMADLSMKYYRAPEYFAQSTWRGTLAMDGGGALMNQGIHGLDLLVHLCGNLERVQCTAETLAHAVEVEDTLAASFTLDGGALGVLTATTSCYPGQARRLEVCGTAGSLRLEEDDLVWASTQSGVEIEAPRAGANGASDPFAIGFELHRRQLQDFVDCILQGRRPALNGQEAAKTLRAAFALYAAAHTGAPVAL